MCAYKGEVLAVLYPCALMPVYLFCYTGSHCLRQLVKNGIKCSYVLINAVSYIMKEVCVCVCVCVMCIAMVTC